MYDTTGSMIELSGAYEIGVAMAGYKVVLTDQVFPTVDLERKLLSEHAASLEIADGTPEDVLAKASDADALLTTYFPMQAETLSQLKQCKIIARYGIGVDNIDLETARQLGIRVTNVPDYSVHEVASHAFAMLLALLRRIPQADEYVRNGGWPIAALRPLRRLSELTFGLIGYGRIARQLADFIRPLGASIIVYDPYVTSAADPLVGLDELLATADAVSVHAPLTADTKGLINAEQLKKMKPEAVLVNTARGGLVVLEDLIAALKEGTIRGAGLDTFEQEPMNPSLIQGVSGLIVTPHMAYYSEEALRESQFKATTQIIKVLNGQEPDYPIV